MTPLYRFFENRLPPWLCYVAVALAYLTMIMALVLFGQDTSDPIIYIDVGY